MTLKQLKFIFLVIAIIISSQSSQSQNLKETRQVKIGEKAPPLKIGKWIRGAPISHFRKGNIYIVEFGSIICGPCRLSIPHLTEISKKYSEKVTVISVFIHENGVAPLDTINTEYMARVATFVKNMGDKIDYHVAVDNPAQTMVKNWMKDVSFIPLAFIINEEAKVTWIGHPFDLDQVVKELVENNNFKGRTDYKKYSTLDSAIYVDLGNGEYLAALSKVDSLILKNSKIKYLFHLKFKILLKINEETAYGFAKEMLQNQCRDDEPVLSKLAVSVLSGRRPDFDLAISLTERAFVLSSDNILSAMILDCQSDAYFRKGDVEKAIYVIEKGIDLVNTSNSVKDDNIKRILENHLTTYKSKLN